jgi:hypothetical protein
MDEWLQHHISQGVSHFFLIDNDSSDDFLPIIKKYSEYITLFKFTEKYVQAKHYNAVLPTIRTSGYTWCCVMDLDEFLVLSDPNISIPEYCAQHFVDDIAQISIRWKLFGSNGYVQQPKSIRTSFTKCWPNLVSYKSFVLISKCKLFDIHSHSVNGRSITCEDALFYHYFLQSWEWYSSVKMTRGAPDINVNVRDINYFKERDALATETDTCLKDRVEAGLYTLQ